MTDASFFTRLPGPLGPTITYQGRDFLYFGGTAYFGIPRNPDFLTLFMEGVSRYGLNNGTSRNNNIQLGIYDEVEEFAASLYGAEAGLISSSGYLAAQLLARNLQNEGQVRYAPGAHPSLYFQHKESSQKGDFKVWASTILEEINESEEVRWVLFSNSLNNLYPEIFDFSFLNAVAAEKQVTLVVDDSHGLGLTFGGQGALRQLPKQKNIECVLIASMAKGLGVDAGLILGSRERIRHLKNSPEFAGASPPAAAALYAFKMAQPVYQEQYQRLTQLIKQMSLILKNKEGWSFVEDFPVFLSADQQLCQKLLNKGVCISAFAYPDIHGEWINRIVLSSWHEKAHLDKLGDILEKITD